MACHKFGPRIWLRFLTAGFGITTFALSFVASYPATMALRVLLGCFESGIQPGIMYSYAQFYRRYAAERISSETLTKEDPQDLLTFKRALLNWNTQLLAFATTCSLMTMSALSFFMVRSTFSSVLPRKLS